MEQLKWKCPLWEKGQLCAGVIVEFDDSGMPTLFCGMYDPKLNYEEVRKYCGQNHILKLYPELIAYLRKLGPSHDLNNNP